MSLERFPIGLEMVISYPEYLLRLTLLSVTQLRLEIQESPFARIETVDIHVSPLGNSLFAVSWKEKNGAAVSQVQDYDRSLIYSHATLPNGEVLRSHSPFVVARPSDRALDDRPECNKALVLEAMSSLFQHHDASAVERLYSPNFIQHNPDMPQGRDALQALVVDLPETVQYEPGLIVAEGDLVAIHGRIHGWTDAPQVVVDIFRIQGGRLVEHWDVMQEEVPSTAAKGGVPMFDPKEGKCNCALYCVAISVGRKITPT